MSKSNDASQYRLRPTRVLQVGPGHGQRGGIASVLEELAGQREAFAEHAVMFSFFETRSSKGIAGVLLYFLIDLPRFVLAMRLTDIVHFHTSVRGSFYRKYLLYVLARIGRKKTIFHLHAGNFAAFVDSSAKWIVRAAAHFIGGSDAAIAVASETARELRALRHVDDNLFVIGNTAGEFEAGAHAPLTHAETPPYVAFAGRLTEAKGVDDALKAVALLKSQGCYVRMKFAGSGDVDGWKRIASAYGIDDRIEFSGWLKGDAKRAFYQNARVFCMPSHHESFGISTLEAMYARLPVVGTRLGGFLDLVEEGETGYLVEARDIEALANRIRILMDTPELARRLGVAGSVRARERYSSTATVAQYVECYRRVAEKKL